MSLPKVPYLSSLTCVWVAAMPSFSDYPPFETVLRQISQHILSFSVDLLILSYVWSNLHLSHKSA